MTKKSLLPGLSGKFYITTSIAYPNARPHIGFAMEVIQADALARYHRVWGDETFYLTGTDEHGTKIAKAAKEKGVTPQAFVDEISASFKDLRGLLNLSNDAFVRTTDDGHMKAAQKLWMKMFEAGDIYKNSYTGLYCVGCESFKTEKDLVDGLCPDHQKAPEKVEEENYFFKLSKYSDTIKNAIASGVLQIVPAAKKHEILAVLDEGLKDVSFSRPKTVLEWGIEVPNDPTQVMYVWGDALSNYITAIGYLDETEQYKKFWPVDVHLIGKDILRFHAAIWIGMLMSAGVALPKAIYVHGHITSEGKKMSKSLNNVVDPYELVAKFGVDALRYYLLKEIPTTEDGDFSKARFDVVYESELANTFGNLVSRVLAMTHKYFEGKVPGMGEDFGMKFENFWKEYDQAIGEFDLKKALEVVHAVAMDANKYVDENKPWSLAKTDQVKLAEVLTTLIEMIRQIALALIPFIPATAEKILSYLGIEMQNLNVEDRVWGGMKKDEAILAVVPLFPRIAKE